MSFLEIDGLVSGYGSAIILRDISLSIDEGDAIAVVGRNGAGKSTLLLSIFGQTTISGGQIRIGGKRIDGHPAYETPKLGVALSPQGRQILPNLTVRENLEMSLATGRCGYWTIQRIFDLFPILSERAHRPGTALSGGQLQMLSIGRALMANPRILLLDEPTEGLAPVLVDVLAGALAEVRRNGTGLLIVEQHHSLVRRTTDTFVVMSKGEIVGRDATTSIDAEHNLHLFAL
jgi:branched-chain amino acid transport system ATP-binding protein